MTAPRYTSPGAFRRALDDRLRTAAKTHGVPLNSLRRQFVLECFLARVFALPDCQWILKGGTGLLVRIPGARYSRDLDLCHAVADQEVHANIDELVDAGRPGPRDPFTFQITRRAALTGNAEGYQLTVAATLGPVYEKFPIDMTSRCAFVGAIETRHKPLPVQIDDVDEPPPMRLYPIGDQVADKVAAMYETHNGHPSGRFRDLVLITTKLSLDTVELTVALRIQELARQMTLPAAMESPDPTWTSGYFTTARDARLPQHLRALDGALEHVGHHLNPALVALRRLPD